MRKHSNTPLLFLALFLFIFPKGGIKIGTLPLTWGYLLLGLTGFFSLFKRNLSISSNHLRLLLSCLPFQLIVVTELLFKEILEPSHLIALLVTSLALPILFFVLLSEAINHLDQIYLFKVIQRGMLFLASYGVVLFIYKLYTGEFFTIPLLTVNLQDLDTLDEKHIDRDFAFKLISTYNNGNLYGISLLMLFPLYKLLETKRWRRFIVLFSFLLTLSRTVWAGLLFAEILYPLVVENWRKGRVKVARRALITCAFMFSFLAMICLYFSIPLAFLLDTTLGGRLNEESFFTDGLHLFSFLPFEEIEEMVYLSMIKNFGLVAAGAFLIMLLTPLFLFITNHGSYLAYTEEKAKESKAIVLGLATYLFVSLSDGAYLLIPTMSFYFFLSALLLREPSPRLLKGVEHF